VWNLGLNWIIHCYLNNGCGGSREKKSLQPDGWYSGNFCIFGRPDFHLSFVSVTRLTFFPLAASSIFRFNVLFFRFNFIILYDHESVNSSRLMEKKHTQKKCGKKKYPDIKQCRKWPRCVCMFNVYSINIIYFKNKNKTKQTSALSTLVGLCELITMSANKFYSLTMP